MMAMVPAAMLVPIRMDINMESPYKGDIISPNISDMKKLHWILVKAFYYLPRSYPRLMALQRSSNTVMHTVKGLNPGVISKYKIQ